MRTTTINNKIVDQTMAKEDIELKIWMKCLHFSQNTNKTTLTTNKEVNPGVTKIVEVVNPMVEETGAIAEISETAHPVTMEPMVARTLVNNRGV